MQDKSKSNRCKGVIDATVSPWRCHCANPTELMGMHCIFSFMSYPFQWNVYLAYNEERFELRLLEYSPRTNIERFFFFFHSFCMTVKIIPQPGSWVKVHFFYCSVNLYTWPWMYVKIVQKRSNATFFTRHSSCMGKPFVILQCRYGYRIYLCIMRAHV